MVGDQQIYRLMNCPLGDAVGHLVAHPEPPHVGGRVADLEPMEVPPGRLVTGGPLVQHGEHGSHGRHSCRMVLIDLPDPRRSCFSGMPGGLPQLGAQLQTPWCLRPWRARSCPPSLRPASWRPTDPGRGCPEPAQRRRRGQTPGTGPPPTQGRGPGRHRIPPIGRQIRSERPTICIGSAP